MKLFWKFYSLLFLSVAMSNLSKILNSNSDISIYYNTSIILSRLIIVPYFLNILQTLMTLITAIFIMGYAYNIKGLSRIFPWFFCLRLLLDVVGHSYEFKIVQAYFTQGALWGMSQFTYMALPFLPSYLALCLMTFKQKGPSIELGP